MLGFANPKTDCLDRNARPDRAFIQYALWLTADPWEGP